MIKIYLMFWLIKFITLEVMAMFNNKHINDNYEILDTNVRHMTLARWIVCIIPLVSEYLFFRWIFKFKECRQELIDWLIQNKKIKKGCE